VALPPVAHEPAAGLASDGEAAVPADERPRKRRRGGRGRNRDGAEPAKVAETPVARPAPEPQARAAPQRDAPGRDDNRRGTSARPDPIRAYRGDRNRDPRRDERRDRDDGERFVGFGPEGIPGFLMHKATIER
jgi:hypothetical protein